MWFHSVDTTNQTTDHTVWTECEQPCPGQETPALELSIGHGIKLTESTTNVNITNTILISLYNNINTIK